MNDEVTHQEIITAPKYDKICRICLTNTDSCNYIFSPVSEDDSCTYAELILYASTVKVIESDALPIGICPDCLDRMLVAYEFRQQIEQSETILKNYLNLCGSSDSMVILVSEESSKNIENKLENSIINNNNHSDFQTKKDENIENGIMLNNLLTEQDCAHEKLGDNKGLKLKIDGEDSLCISNKSVEFVDFQQVSITEDDTIENVRKNIVKYSDYDCTMCFGSFENIQQLKAHIRNHPKGSRHYCRICFKSYARASILKRHFFTHNGVKDHCCKICGKAFFYLHALRSHIMFHKMRFWCTYCKKRFAFRRTLLKHLKTLHFDCVPNGNRDIFAFGIQEDPESDLDQIENSKNLEYDCSMCFKTFNNTKDLIVHKRTHPIGEKHMCRICSKTYTQAASLQRHIITHSSTNPYLCPLCGKSYSLRNSLKSHLLYHGDKMFKCEHCLKKFHTKYGIEEHTRLTHSDGRYKFMCELCGKLCTSGSRLAVHRESHSSYCCPYCAKIYRNLYVLKTHIKKHDDDPKPKNVYICDYCGVKRGLKIFMERHILKKHLKKRAHQCTDCNKAFCDKNGLNQHKNVHLKRLHQCHVCGRALTSKRSLMLHQNLHTGQRPFSCDICGKAFASSSAKYVHQKRWHVVGKYQCGTCLERFRYARDLHKHMPIHTNRIQIHSILSKII